MELVPRQSVVLHVDVYIISVLAAQDEIRFMQSVGVPQSLDPKHTIWNTHLTALTGSTHQQRNASERAIDPGECESDKRLDVMSAPKVQPRLFSVRQADAGFRQGLFTMQ